MGGRDHSCVLCGKGGFNNDEPCTCPSPYYQDDWVTLYCADCRDVDGGQADAFLTDPPYGVAGMTGGHRTRGKAAYIPDGWEDTPEYVERVVIPVITGFVASIGRGAVTPGQRHVRLYPEPVAEGCFWTPTSVTWGAWGFNTMQPILYYGRDPRMGRGQSPAGRSMTSAAPKNGHPCPKPLDAWKWLLNKVTLPGETVFDPFVGSGTTLVAAKALGRRAIGVEIEERYCEIAARACAQDVFDLEAA